LVADWKIEDVTIEQIKAELALLGAARWREIRYELQDGAKCLFIRIDVHDEMMDDETEEVCELIESVVRPKIPNRPGDVSWVAVVCRRGNFVASAQSEIL
jgi:hypothetical protein